jgi:peptide subunit release factor 1 (eRF1)
MLLSELSTAANIKGKATRKDVSKALRAAKEKLSSSGKAIFDNGFALFSGWTMQV